MTLFGLAAITPDKTSKYLGYWLVHTSVVRWLCMPELSPPRGQCPWSSVEQQKMAAQTEEASPVARFPSGSWTYSVDNMFHIVSIHFFRYYITLKGLLISKWTSPALKKAPICTKSYPRLKGAPCLPDQKRGLVARYSRTYWSQRHTNYLVSLSRKHLFSVKKIPWSQWSTCSPNRNHVVSRERLWL
jgi:hypothetical protein